MTQVTTLPSSRSMILRLWLGCAILWAKTRTKSFLWPISMKTARKEFISRVRARTGPPWHITWTSTPFPGLMSSKKSPSTPPIRRWVPRRGVLWGGLEMCGFLAKRVLQKSPFLYSAPLFLLLFYLLFLSSFYLYFFYHFILFLLFYHLFSTNHYKRN